MDDRTLLSPWIRRFLLEHLVGERNLSLNTQRSYRDMLMLLVPFVAERLDKPADRLEIIDLSADTIRDFLAHLEQERSCTPSTRNQRLGGIHALARFIGMRCPEWLEWCGQIRLIPFKKSPQPMITALDRDEMDAILNAPNRSTVQGCRDYAVLIFLYNSGARASEVAQLRLADIDWHARSAQILGKGGKRRSCPLWQSTLETLREITAGRDLADRVFLNRLGQPVTRSGIHTLVKRLASRAVATAPSLATKIVGPHVIRHTTATHLLRAGVDINTIRGWLGHVSLNTTHIYAEIDLETKARALASCAVEDDTPARQLAWREQPELMAFLRSL